jgi:hypothetical protein
LVPLNLLVSDAKTRSCLCPITKFDVIVCLVAVQSILQPAVPLSAPLQTKDFDLIQAVVGSKTVIDLQITIDFFTDHRTPHLFLISVRPPWGCLNFFFTDHGTSCSGVARGGNDMEANLSCRWE